MKINLFLILVVFFIPVVYSNEGCIKITENGSHKVPCTGILATPPGQISTPNNSEEIDWSESAGDFRLNLSENYTLLEPNNTEPTNALHIPKLGLVIPLSPWAAELIKRIM